MAAASPSPNIRGMPIELRPGRLSPRSQAVLRKSKIQTALLTFLGNNIRAYRRFKRGIATSRILDEHRDLRGMRSRGSFVSIASRNSLIGCRGSTGQELDLVTELRTNAINAAFNDSRHSRPLRGPGRYLEIHAVIFTEIQKVTLRGPKDLARHLKPGRVAYALYGRTIRAMLLPEVVQQCPSPEAVFRRLLEKSRREGAELDRVRFPLRLCRAQAIEFGGRVKTSGQLMQ